jgi:peptidoglycan/xylan/chitin deacetylase (PgdA/CDA1 family)
MIRAIMYHYVRPVDNEFPYLKYLSIQKFEKQLDYFEKKFGFVRKEDFENFINNSESDCSGIVLTFDDGLKDHYDYVFPILKRRGLWGIFYISSAPLRSKKMLDVHKIHALIGKFGGIKVSNSLSGFILDEMISNQFVQDFDEKVYVSQENDLATERVKKILNYLVSEEYKPLLINKLMRYFFSKNDEENLINQYYMNVQEIGELNNHGMMIGSHTDSHHVMSKLTKSQQEEEIRGSFKVLDEMIDQQNLKTFCYPYGGRHSFTKLTENLLKKYSVDFSFSVEAEIIKCNDPNLNLQTLPRFDCNKFPHGKSF